MKPTTRTPFYIVLLFGLTTSAVADETRPRPKAHTPPPSGFKLDLNTRLNPTNTPPPPPGTSTLARENNGPFLGLKLTKPLGN